MMQKEKTAIELPEKAWNFPHLGKTIKAPTREKALEQLKKLSKTSKK